MKQPGFPKATEKLERVGPRGLVLAACSLSLLALGLMSWSVLDPTPLPVMVVMSVGQVIGSLGLACYLAAVVVYQWRGSKRRDGHAPQDDQAS